MFPYFKLHYARLRNPAFRAFLQTPAWITFMVISAEVRPHISTVRPGSDIPELRNLYDRSGDEHWVRIAPRGDADEQTDLPSQGWLCAAVSGDHLQKQFPERSVELIQADIEQLGAMGLLEIHRVRLNGEATHILKVGEWQFDELSENN